MRISAMHTNIVQLIKQRNAFFIALLMSLLVNMVLGLISIKFSNQVKTILVPTEFKQSFWLSDKSVSENYLAEMARYMSFLLLNVTKKNIDFNKDKLLSMVHPANFNEVQQQFNDIKAALTKKNLTTAFYVSELMPDTDNLTVIVKGQLVSFIGKQKMTPQDKVYRIEFVNEQQHLMLKRFSEHEHAS